MTDREKKGLKGPVKSCADAVARWTYRPDGSLAEVQYRSPDGSTLTTVYLYDEAGRLSETRSEWGVLEHHYTPQGELERTTSGERLVESWGRDERGRRTRTRHVDVPAKGAMAYQVEGSDSACVGEEAAAIKTVYDEHEQPVETLFYDAEQRLVNRVELVYDEAGRLMEEAQHLRFPASLFEKMGPEQIEAVQALCVGLWKTRHRYDADGRRVETTTDFGPLGGERMTLAYNEHGDEVERIVVGATRELALDEKGRPVEPEQPPGERRFEVRQEYQYDEHGNWTEQVVSSRQKLDEAFTVTNTERRAIEYY